MSVLKVYIKTVGLVFPMFIFFMYVLTKLLSKPTIYQLERVVPSGFLALIYSFLSKIAIMAHKKWCHLTESHKRTKFGFFM